MFSLPLISEQLQEDLLILLDGQPQALQDHACQIVVDNLRGPVLPGEALPPAAPAPLNPVPVLPLINYSQQQQQQQQAPAQLVAPGPLARKVAPFLFFAVATGALFACGTAAALAGIARGDA